MTAALLDSPAPLFAQAGAGLQPSGGRMTLEERLRGTWRALQAEGAAECPVCSARMALEEGAGACGSCGSRLS